MNKDLIARTVVSSFMAIAVTVIGYKTGSANCLWALFFIGLLW